MASSEIAARFLTALLIALTAFSELTNARPQPQDFTPVPQPTTEQMASTRFSLNSRPTVNTILPVEIEQQLEALTAQRSKVEQMKMKLLQQLDQFRDQYYESLKTATINLGFIDEEPLLLPPLLSPQAQNVVNSSSPSPAAPINKLSTTTGFGSGSVESTTDVTTTTTTAAKEIYLEVEVNSPPILIHRKNNNAVVPISK